MESVLIGKIFIRGVVETCGCVDLVIGLLAGGWVNGHGTKTSIGSPMKPNVTHIAHGLLVGFG